MHELIANLHIHTRYSDGSGTHAEIASSALKTGVDVVIITDHNVLVKGLDAYYEADGRRVLLLTGEEVHDQARDPQKNHLLVIGATREMATFAANPQNLIDQASRAGGLTFLAHPDDEALTMFNETDITWVDWDAYGYTGIELWNAFSELKSVVRSKLDAFFYAYMPQYIARGPLEATLQKWDELMASGSRVVAIGGSDSHALHYSLGPLKRVLFPYEFHFQGVNTHLLAPRPLSDDLSADRRMVLETLGRGNCYIGYDLPASTAGFRFMAHGREENCIMGDEISLQEGVTFQIRLPMKTECRLLHNGKVVRAWEGREVCAYNATQPGAYRVECSIEYLGRQRGWIYSNPIYVRAPAFSRSRLARKA